MSKAVFFDRDGVLNREIGNYITKPEDFELLPDAVSTMKAAADKGYKIFVVTNQGGIGKQMYTRETLAAIHDILLSACSKEGIAITEIFYCPHHPVSSHCICRKPDSLMLEKAIAKYGISVQDSWMIGDTERDINAAAKVGLRSFLVHPNDSKQAFVAML